ncbi:MAG TPA: hypothetical protein VGQ71_14435 [Terriglobales bacterium]|jgi:outer membrane lipoprotein-sorting protein|nr:hypothetical protein [Terriglobales bacterium]
MGRRFFSVFTTLFLVISQAAFGQKPQAIKDPQALAIAQQALAAMDRVQGRITYQDSVGEGTLVLNGPQPVSIPVTLRTKGTRQVRVELQGAPGSTVRVLNSGRAVVQSPDGSRRKLILNNTLAERVTHIPAFSILAESDDPSVNVEYGGAFAISVTAGVVPSVNAEKLSFSAVSSDAADFGSFREITRNSVYVDKVTGMALKIEHTNYSENNPSFKTKVETYFSDYRDVQGILVPFRQTTYYDGKLESDLWLKSVTFNVGLSDTEFALPE